MISCRVSLVLTLVVLACLVPGSLARKKGKRPAKRAENVTCPSGKHNYYVELEAGKNFTFELEDYYGDRSRCRVEYRVGSCSNVIVQSIGYNLKGKSCYTRTVGEGKSDESKAMKVRVCAEDVEKWPANDTDSSEDPSKIGMMQDSDSWDDVGINQDFVMAFNAPKGVANKGNSIMLNVHCEAGIKFKPDEFTGCQCGLQSELAKERGHPSGNTWEIFTQQENEDTYWSFQIASEWALITLPVGVTTFTDADRFSHDLSGGSLINLTENIWMYKFKTFFNSVMNPICLPSVSSFKKKTKRVITHVHRYHKENKTYAIDSTEANVKVLPKALCNKRLAAANRLELNDGEGCVVPIKKTSPTVCQNGFGAPLYAKVDSGTKKNLALFGIITELPDGVPCATVRMPARFQRIDKAMLEKISNGAEDAGVDFTSCPAHPTMPNCFPTNQQPPFYCQSGVSCQKITQADGTENYLCM